MRDKLTRAMDVVARGGEAPVVQPACRVIQQMYADDHGGGHSLKCDTHHVESLQYTWKAIARLTCKDGWTYIGTTLYYQDELPRLARVLTDEAW
jgi:hypothetical protein